MIYISEKKKYNYYWQINNCLVYNYKNGLKILLAKIININNLKKKLEFINI